MREREYEQGVGDPFDSPVPGQSLTDTPGNYLGSTHHNLLILKKLQNIFGLLCIKNN